MLTAKDLVQGSDYTFSIYPAQLLASPGKATFEGLVTYGVASKLQPGIGGKHLIAYPYLPEGGQKDPEKLSWAIFEKDGQTFVFATDWINFASVVLNAVSQTSVILTGLTPAQHKDLRTLLIKNNYQVSSITQV